MDSEIEKLKFHIRQLAEAVDSDEHPIAPLVIQLDWDCDDLNAAHDCFEKYSKLLEQGGHPAWGQLEQDLKARFHIGYQEVKTIVIAFYRNSQWLEVCEWFAKGQEPNCPMELKQILRPR